MKLDELKDMPIWVCWKYGSVRANGKRSKIPINPKTGKNAQTNNPATWSTYEQAYNSVYEDLYNGVGLMLVNGLMGIDIDAVFNPETNEIEESTQKIIDLFDSYTEITPSGKGFHILCTGIKPAGIGSKIVTNSIESLEFYQSKQDESGAVLNGRFFTFTGNSYHIEPKEIEDRTDCINKFCKEFFTKENPAIKKKQETNQHNTVYISNRQESSKSFTDESLVRYCGNNFYSGKQFNQLFFSGYPAGANMSIEDLAFIGYMVKAGCYDPDQLDRVYRKSAIYRDKWDEIHDGKRTYGQMTIDKALEGVEMIKESKSMDDEFKKKFVSVDRIEFNPSLRNNPIISTGFKNLDDALYGGLSDELYILGAVPGSGKSAFCMQIMENIAESGIPVLVYALEMGKNELIARGVSRQSFLMNKANPDIKAYPFAEILRKTKVNGKFVTLDYSNYQLPHEQYKRLFKDNLFIIENNGDKAINVDAVYSDVEDFVKATGKAPVILVDYSQMLAPSDNDSTQADRKTKLDYIVRKLKVLSIKFETPVIAISSLNRDSYGANRKDNKPVSMDSFKESGDIEYTANVLFGMDREDDGEDVNCRDISISILKGRNICPKKSGIHFKYYPAYNQFEEVWYPF